MPIKMTMYINANEHVDERVNEPVNANANKKCKWACRWKCQSWCFANNLDSTQNEKRISGWSQWWFFVLPATMIPPEIALPLQCSWLQKELVRAMSSWTIPSKFWSDIYVFCCKSMLFCTTRRQVRVSRVVVFAFSRNYILLFNTKPSLLVPYTFFCSAQFGSMAM